MCPDDCQASWADAGLKGDVVEVLMFAACKPLEYTL